MTNEQRMVTEFHRAFAIAIGTSPALPDAATCSLRLRLLYQSCDELQDTVAHQDLEGTARSLAELLYLVYGTAISCGIDLDPVFQEVHRSNMSKVGVHQNADGTWVKPSSYTPPSVQPILAAQQPEGWVQDDLHVELFDGESSSPLPPSETRHVPEPSIERPRQPFASILQAEATLELPVQRPSKSRTAPAKTVEYATLDCPQCGKDFVRRSKRKGMMEGLWSIVRRYPFRCRICGHRFKAFQFRKPRPAQPQREHRRNQRQPVNIPVTFEEIVQLGESKRGEGVLHELSPNNALLHTSMQLSQGALLSLEIHLPDNALPLHVEVAVVRSVRLHGFGLEFLRFAALEQQRLKQFVQEFLTTPVETEEE